MTEQPDCINALKAAVNLLPGILDTGYEFKWFNGLSVDQLSSPAYALWPITSLRRSNGPHPHEGLLSFDIKSSYDRQGMIAHEFLAWWTRDCARGGELVEYRLIGFPPQAGEVIQIGCSLRARIDFFFSDEQQDGRNLFPHIKKHANSLRFAISLYHAALGISDPG